MASSATIEEDRMPCKEKIYQQWQESTSKLIFGEHELKLELFDDDEQFIQKAKEELRETPEMIAECCEELKKLIAGRTRSIILKKHRSAIEISNAKREGQTRS